MTDIDKYIRVPPSGNGLRSTYQKRSRNFRYGRIPDDLLADKSISDRAVRLYGIMAMYTFEGNVVSIGIRKMASVLGSGNATALRMVRSLEAGGYILIQAGVNGRRSFYELTSPVFAQKQGKVDVIRSGPRGSRLVSVERKGNGIKEEKDEEEEGNHQVAR